MTYRKFKADYLFTGDQMMAGDAVLVTDEAGIIEGILPAAEAGEGVEVLKGVLCPGLINCHCHLELSHMKGVLPPGTGLVDFLLGVMGQRNRTGNAAAGAGAVTTGSGQVAGSAGGAGAADAGAGAVGDSVSGAAAGDSAGAGAAGAGSGKAAVSAGGITDMEAVIAEAIVKAEQYMLDRGIVAVGDICNTTATVAQKSQGQLYYHNFIETMGFVPQTATDRFAQSLKVFEAFAQVYAVPVASNSIVPHAPYSVSGRLFELIANFPGNQLLTIHNQESPAENEFYRHGGGDFLRLYRAMGLDVSFFGGAGKNSLATYLPYFYRNQTLILVHNVATAAEDLQALPAGLRLFFCLCPNANLYIGAVLPDVDLLMRSGCRMVLGTDSLASNQQLDILEEAKTLQDRFPQLSTATLLQWATSNGAEALQMESVLGSFAPGKQPGIVLIEGGEGDRLTAEARARRIL